MSEEYKRNPNTKCLVCEKPIYRRPCEIKRGNVFCSCVCNGQHCRKESPCVVCGKPILAKLNKKTCSRSCANTHRSGIKYKIGRPRDKAKTFQLIKAHLIEVRGGKCEKCDYNKIEILQIHHKNRDREDNRLENLELVCPNCHYEEHYAKMKK